MAVDIYVETLKKMIEMFQEYKPGSVTLDNITKLCQTLGLESFIDDIDSNTSRLSTASKIIVIDIDFDKKEEIVKDVKLVLASNFDHFNYYNTSIDHIPQAPGSTPDTYDKNKNILYNSLTQYPTLHEFHHNLQYLYLLDSYSHLEVDASNTSNNVENGTENSSSINISSRNSNTTAPGNLDLFKYYTELSRFLNEYFVVDKATFSVTTNMNDMFGIYINSTDSPQTSLARIYLEKAKDPQSYLYEYTFSSTDSQWVNEHPDSFSVGISLVLEIIDDSICAFPIDLIPKEVIFEEAEGTSENQNVMFSVPSSSNKKGLALSIINMPLTSKRSTINIMNDFTTNMVDIKKFDVSNDNLDMITEILRWHKWYKVVIKPILEILTESDNTNQTSSQNSNFNHTRLIHSRSHIKPEHPSKNIAFQSNGKRPSVTEATMLKDEGLQQFNLNEIMSEPVINEEEEETGQGVFDSQDNYSSSKIPSSFNNNIDMEEDVNKNHQENISSHSKKIDDKPYLVLSEDQVMLGDIARCNIYDDVHQWDSFIEKLKAFI